MTRSEHLLATDSGSPLLLGKPVMQGDMETALNEIARLSKSSRPELVVTANVDHVVNLSENAEFRNAYDGAALRTIDGAPVVALYRMLGADNVSRVTGADLLFTVCDRAAASGLTVAITGGPSSTTETAALSLMERFPGLKITSIDFPMINSIDDPKSSYVINDLETARPDIVFLCLGSPKQELWFTHWRESLPAAAYICAGAAVDFAAGTKRRAPSWLQKTGLEWLYRMFSDFKRLAPRYIGKGPRFIPIALEAFRTSRTH